MARCYANENVPFPTVEALRALSHDVLTTVESGRAGQAMPDRDVLAFAVAEDRLVITLNRRHVMRLHHTTSTHTGIIVCTFDLDFAALAQRIQPEFWISLNRATPHWHTEDARASARLSMCLTSGVPISCGLV